MRIFYTHKISRQKIAGKAEAKNTRINSPSSPVLILITTQAENAHLENNHIDKYQVMKA